MQPNLQKIPALQKIDVQGSVVLRPLETTDAGALLGILDADPTIRERVGVASRLHSTHDIDTLLEEERDDTAIIRYVILESGMVVGLINFWRAGGYFGDKADPDDYGFGYFLAPSARGRGLVTSSLAAIMNVAVEQLAAKRFIAFCEADNLASSAALKKAGFKQTDIAWEDTEHDWVEQKYQREA